MKRILFGLLCLFPGDEKVFSFTCQAKNLLKIVGQSEKLWMFALNRREQFPEKIKIVTKFVTLGPKTVFFEMVTISSSAGMNPVLIPVDR